MDLPRQSFLSRRRFAVAALLACSGVIGLTGCGPRRAARRQHRKDEHEFEQRIQEREQPEPGDDSSCRDRPAKPAAHRSA